MFKKSDCESCENDIELTIIRKLYFRFLPVSNNSFIIFHWELVKGWKRVLLNLSFPMAH